MLVKFCLKTTPSKKEPKSAVSQEEPSWPSDTSLMVVQSEVVLSMEKSLLAMEMIAKHAVNLEAVSFDESKDQLSSSDPIHLDICQLCHHFVSHCTTRSLRSMKRLESDSFCLGRDIPMSATLSFARLISKSFDTITELQAPLSVAVCQAIARCRLLTNLVLCGHVSSTQEQESLVTALEGKSRLKMLDVRDPIIGPVLVKAILGTNAQLDAFGCFRLTRILSRYYWPRVQHLATHPLKTVSLLHCHYGVEEGKLRDTVAVCPQLKQLNLGPCFLSMPNPLFTLHLVSEYFATYSAAVGQARALIVHLQAGNRPVAVEYLQRMQAMAAESGELANCIVIAQLDSEVPEVAFYRGKAVFRAKVTCLEHWTTESIQQLAAVCSRYMLRSNCMHLCVFLLYF